MIVFIENFREVSEISISPLSSSNNKVTFSPLPDSNNRSSIRSLNAGFRHEGTMVVSPPRGGPRDHGRG